MKKRVISLLLSLILIICCMPISVFAADSATVVVKDYTTTQGGYAYVDVYAKNFVNVAAIDIEIYYDSDAMSVNSVSNSTLFSGASVSTNTSIVGIVKVSAMSVNGFNSTNTAMMRITFKINANCPEGSYPIKVAVGDAYDCDMLPASIDSVGGNVTVNKAAAQTFTLSASKNSSTLECGDELSLSVKNSNSREFASADFHITYDREQFEFVSLELENSLKNSGAVYSINSSIEGLVVLSYASTNAISSYSLFTVKLKVIADTNTSAKITVDASDVYDNNMSAYASYTYNTTVNLVKTEVLPDHKNISLGASEYFVGQSFNTTLTLEAGATVAAGDFVVSYDTDVFECNDVTVADDVSAAGAMVVINPNYSEGEIRFSYINQSGANADSLELIQLNFTPISTPQTHSGITVIGADVCDINYNDVMLDYIGASDCIFDHRVIEPTCTEIGYTIYECGCGENYIVDEVSALGHNEIKHEAKNETCTEVGWNEYVTCSRCDYTTYKEIAELGHNEVTHDAKAPTCTQVGWNEYVTCSRCDYTTYEEISATGHTTSDWIVDTEPTCIANGSKHKECTVCKEVILTESIAMLGHVETVHEAKAPTCTEIGWNEYVTCSRCDYTTYEEISAAGHTTSDWIVDTNSTCIADGSKHKECTICKEVLLTESIAMLGHDETVHEAKAPTCTQIGWDEYVTCSRCDYTTYEEISAAGHTTSDWIVDTEPTCIANGSKHKECTVCKEVILTESIAMLGHDETVHEAKAPTCTEIGWNEYVTCSRCDYTTYKEIEATGHTTSDWIVDTEPTCIANGSKHKECTVCKEVILTESIAMLGHVETVHEAKAPTCTEIGWDEYVTCSRCDYTTYKEIGATGAHNHVGVVTDPTCTSQGYTTYTCNMCSDSYVADYINALGHNYDDDFDAFCNVCNAERNAKKHGDINCDGILNGRDASLLMQYINGWNVEIDTTAADLNGDGKINNKDYVYLIRKLNGWENY